MPQLEMRTWPLELAPGGEVRIEADMASVTVLRVGSGEAPRAELAEEALKWFELSVVNQDGAARIALAMRRENFRKNWLDWFTPRKGGLTVYLPDGLDVYLHAAAGKVCVQDLDVESLEVVADAGAVNLRQLRGAIRARASAGKIDGEDLAGSLDVQATTGAVRLRLDALAAGEHFVRADVGTVQVELPRGAAVRVLAESSLGSVRDEFASAPDAPAVLHVAANIGTVRVSEIAAATFAPERPAPSSRPRRAAVATAIKGRSDEEVAHVLKMVEDGVLSANDAADILKAMDGR